MLSRTYTITTKEGVKACTLECTDLFKSLGIMKVKFANIRKAAQFAQKHSNGDPEATLRVMVNGEWTSRPIPQPDHWIPIAEADFHSAFVNLPVEGQVRRGQRGYLGK